jgi:hypothetical protein
VDLESALRDAVSSPLAGTFGFRGNWLVGSIQVAFTMALLVGAALLVKSFFRIQSFDPGYDSTRAVTVRFDLPRARYRTDADVARFVELLTDRMRAVPGSGRSRRRIECAVLRRRTGDAETAAGRPDPRQRTARSDATWLARAAASPAGARHGRRTTP